MGGYFWSWNFACLENNTRHDSEFFEASCSAIFMFLILLEFYENARWFHPKVVFVKIRNKKYNRNMRCSEPKRPFNNKRDAPLVHFVNKEKPEAWNYWGSFHFLLYYLSMKTTKSVCFLTCPDEGEWAQRFCSNIQLDTSAHHPI